MKTFLLIVIFCVSNAVLANTNIANEPCVVDFEQDVIKILEADNVRDIRLMSEVTIHRFQAKKSNSYLIQISARFGGKWPGDSTESSELIGGRFVYYPFSEVCQPIDVMEFSRLRK